MFIYSPSVPSSSHHHHHHHTLRSICFRHWPRSPCNTMILSEQVIGLGMGSWLDLWEKMIMYDLRPASCPCNFPLYSGVLASLMEVFYWPGTDQPAINQRASHAFAPPSVASQLLSLDRSSAAQVVALRRYSVSDTTTQWGRFAFGSPCDVDGSTFCLHVSAPPPEGGWPCT